MIVSLFFPQLLWEVPAADFRVESRVYAEADKQPSQHRIALFDESATYDLAAVDPGRASILLRDEQMLVLIDMVKRQYTRVSRIDLDRYVAEQRKRIDEMPPERQAILNPTLKEEWNPGEQTLSLINPHLTYVARLIKVSPELVRRYQEFADWHARLNAIIPGAPSPTPRLVLNKAIAIRGSVPAEVTKTHVLRAKNSVRLRSEHRYESNWRDDDRRRVRQIAGTYSAYEKVALSEFLRAAAAARTPQQ